MKILFLTHPYPNYVPDLLLHGLRKLLGPDVVDSPRKACLYEGVLGLGVCPPNQLCPGWFPSDEGGIDRTEIALKIARGHFDAVVCDRRAFADWRDRLADARLPVAVIDGEDRPHPLPPGGYVVFRRETDGTDYSIPLPMALPEEILHWIAAYDGEPKRYPVGFLGSTHDGRRRALVAGLAARHPGCLFSASAVPSPENPFPEGRFGRDDYYRELQRCRVVLSLAGAGWDTFRFWENAACNAVHLAQRMPLAIPEDFREGEGILRFAGTADLYRQVERALSMPEGGRGFAAAARAHLRRHHLTVHRARYFLDRLRRAFAGR
jgi:hypothetical protein